MLNPSISSSYIMKATVVSSIDEETKFKKQYEKHLRALKLQEMSKKTIECYTRSLRHIYAYFNNK